MKAFLIIFICCLIAYLISFGFISANQPKAKIWKLPLNTFDRQEWTTVSLESDAYFKALRAPFGAVKLHYHTGIDIYGGKIDPSGSPVYAIATGKVIAIEDSPPQRRITIMHDLPDGGKVWSVYIHVINEQVKVGDLVDTETIIARLMNVMELEMNGWEYNHIHLEIMRKLPPATSEYSQRKTFTCYTPGEVDEYYFNPEIFLKRKFQKSIAPENLQK